MFPSALRASTHWARFALDGAGGVRLATGSAYSTRFARLMESYPRQNPRLRWENQTLKRIAEQSCPGNGASKTSSQNCGSTEIHPAIPSNCPCASACLAISE